MVQDFTTDEGIPLTEDILKELPKEFIKSWLEWASDATGIQQIIKNRTITGGESTVYTVPKGHTLFITSAWISTVCTAAAALRNGFFRILTIGNLLEVWINGAGTNAQQSSIYPMPIKIEELVSLRVGAAVNAQTSGGFTGFLQSKVISKG